jgi:hypothetical protein
LQHITINQAKFHYDNQNKQKKCFFLIGKSAFNNLAKHDIVAAEENHNISPATMFKRIHLP